MGQSDYRKRVARAALPRPTPYEAIAPTTDSEAQLPRN